MVGARTARRALALLIILGLSVGPSFAQGKPNVVLIFMDKLRLG
jgi:hypothetical protein